MEFEAQILIANHALDVQTEFAQCLGSTVNLMGAVNQAQLDFWLTSSDYQPDVFLLDHAFVGQNLQKFCTSWKENPITRDITLLVMGEDDDETELRALSAGATDYFRKPLNISLCVKRIQLQLARLEEVRRLEALSVTDGLTQVANRRYFDDFLQAEWRRAAREKGNVGLIMLDIDHFKLYNDHYGHVEGDDSLKKVAQCLREQVQRPRDLVARFGGEEFALVLPSIHYEGMKVVAERIQQAIEGLQLPHLLSPTAPYVSVSMGLAWAEPNHDESQTSLIEAADEALYAAKAAGRAGYSRTLNITQVSSMLAAKTAG